MRAWKLWFLLPRMLLHREPKRDWDERFAASHAGRWETLLCQATPTVQATFPAATTQPAQHKGHGTSSTLVSCRLRGRPLAELRGPARRPTQPYQELDPAVLEFQPDEPAHLLPEVVLANLRRARKGAAPGPSGLTARSPVSCWTMRRRQTGLCKCCNLPGSLPKCIPK